MGITHNNIYKWLINRYFIIYYRIIDSQWNKEIKPTYLYYVVYIYYFYDIIELKRVPFYISEIDSCYLYGTCNDDSDYLFIRGL